MDFLFFFLQFRFPFCEKASWLWQQADITAWRNCGVVWCVVETPERGKLRQQIHHCSRSTNPSTTKRRKLNSCGNTKLASRDRPKRSALIIIIMCTLHVTRTVLRSFLFVFFLLKTIIKYSSLVLCLSEIISQMSSLLSSCNSFPSFIRVLHLSLSSSTQLNYARFFAQHCCIADSFRFCGCVNSSNWMIPSALIKQTFRLSLVIKRSSSSFYSSTLRCRRRCRRQKNLWKLEKWDWWEWFSVKTESEEMNAAEAAPTTVFNKLPFKETPSNNPQHFAFHLCFLFPFCSFNLHSRAIKPSVAPGEEESWEKAFSWSDFFDIF